MIFTSDNASGAAPEVMAALARANEGHAPSYGADPLTRTVEDRVRELFEAPEARVHLVATGTAANGLALATLCPPWGAVFCHREAHVEVDECNAPEFFTGGAKLALLEGRNGRISEAALARAIAAAGAGVVHAAQPSALSLTQATERGAVYSAGQVTALSRLARDAGLGVHMDGTRFANALARTGASPAELSWKAGVDVLCLGATKCGALAAEAVVLFDPGKSWELELRRKRGGHLFSKMRFVAAQMDAWLTDGLWLRLASHANAMADRLAAGLEEAGVPLLAPVEANLVFARLTLGQHWRLQAEGARYHPWPGTQDTSGPDDATLDVRLVASFATREPDVDRFLSLLRG